MGCCAETLGNLSDAITSINNLPDCCYLKFFCVPFVAQNHFSYCHLVWLRSVLQGGSDSIHTPNRVETSIGTLEFLDYFNPLRLPQPRPDIGIPFRFP